MKTSPKRRAVKRPTPTRGVKASVFVEAARSIAEVEVSTCCIAIFRVVHGHEHWVKLSDYEDIPENRYLTALLKPQFARSNMPWYWEGPHGDTRFARTLGLLLCAELVKDGFTPEGWTP